MVAGSIFFMIMLGWMLFSTMVYRVRLVPANIYIFLKDMSGFLCMRDGETEV